MYSSGALYRVVGVFELMALGDTPIVCRGAAAMSLFPRVEPNSIAIAVIAVALGLMQKRVYKGWTVATQAWVQCAWCSDILWRKLSVH